jgi:hypothetical protein
MTLLSPVVDLLAVLTWSGCVSMLRPKRRRDGRVLSSPVLAL